MAKSQTITSDFYCTKCGRKGIPIARKIGSQREAEHLKNLYCIYCKEVVNHAEIRPFGDYRKEDFLEEFKLGRFTKEGLKIPIAELMSCTRIECEYNKNGKCWNSNYSYDCSYRPRREENE